MSVLPRYALSLPIFALLMLAYLTGCTYSVNGLSQAGSDITSQNHQSSPPSASSTTETGKTRTSNKPTITLKKKTTGYDPCSLLTPGEVAQSLGAQSGISQGCQFTTRAPGYKVDFVTFFGDRDPRAQVFDIRGNTAYKFLNRNSGSCHIIVMLTDDPKEAMPAFEVIVEPLGDATVDVCGPAITLTTKGFDRIPNG